MQQQRAFTLVELSIVLVILGLLVGGVLAGQSLIRSSELRAITAEKDKHMTALYAFREKYFSLPGDMSNATSFWGAAHATPATCVTTASTGVETCNGDGNGEIASRGLSSPAASNFELFRAWQQLANAGLVEGQFTGVAGGAATYHTIPGTNTPRSKLNGGGWMLFYEGSYGDAIWFTANYRHILVLGSQVANSWSYAALIKAEEAWNIDTKLDDGAPGTGRLLTLRNALLPNCSDNSTYTVSNTNSAACSLIFITGF